MDGWTEGQAARRTERTREDGDGWLLDRVRSEGSDGGHDGASMIVSTYRCATARLCSRIHPSDRRHRSRRLLTAPTSLGRRRSAAQTSRHRTEPSHPLSHTQWDRPSIRLHQSLCIRVVTWRMEWIGSIAQHISDAFDGLSLTSEVRRRHPIDVGATTGSSGGQTNQNRSTAGQTSSVPRLAVQIAQPLQTQPQPPVQLSMTLSAAQSTGPSTVVSCVRF